MQDLQPIHRQREGRQGLREPQVLLQPLTAVAVVRDAAAVEAGGATQSQLPQLLCGPNASREE